MENNTLRYSDEDLAEFKTLILNKLNIAREELNEINTSLNRDTAVNDETREEGTPVEDNEYLHKQAARQRQFIQQLDAALTRIDNKTYGICRASGKLIQKERLRAVPHTTLSMEAKMQQS